MCCAPTTLPPPSQPPPSSDWACTLIITHYHSSTQRHAFNVSFVLCGVLATSTVDHDAKHERGLIKPGCGSVLPGTRHYIYSLCRHQAAVTLSTAKAPVDYMQIKMTWVQDVKRRVLFINSSTRRVDAFTGSVLTEWIELGVSGKCVSPTVIEVMWFVFGVNLAVASLIACFFFYPPFQKNSSSNLSVPSQVWSVAPLRSLNSLSHLSQWGPRCQAVRLKMF